MAKIGVVDYGLGNIHSVRKALAYCGAEVMLVSGSASFDDFDGVVLPGVGAFGDGMEKLKKTGLIPELVASVKNGRPLLGICLGMQFLFSVSEEMGTHHGLNLIPGRVVALPRARGKVSYKVPHIGWEPLIVPRQLKTWQGTILEGVAATDEVYFVHSYIVVPDQEKDTLAFSEYAGIRFAAAVRKGGTYGCQFHPEKSRQTGIDVLKNFLHAAQEFSDSYQKNAGR